MTAQLLDSTSADYARSDKAWQSLSKAFAPHPRLSSLLQSLLWLAQVSDALVTDIFSQTTAEGSLMRRKLQPITAPIFQRFEQLLKS